MPKRKPFSPFGVFLFLPLAFLLALTGCGNKDASESTAPNPNAPIVDLSTAGTITGTVTLDGPPPAPKRIDMSAEPHCMAANSAPVYYPMVLVGEKGALANVVIYVKSGLGAYRYDTPKDPVILDQKGCMYEPHVLALMVNQTLDVKNDDPTVHNVHAAPLQNREWNKSEDIGAAPIEEKFPRPEMAIPVMCNVHPWMRAFAFVFDNPYFAVTSASGAFALKNLPPGTYTIEAWQEKFGVLDQTVTIAPSQSQSVSFTFKSTQP